MHHLQGGDGRGGRQEAPLRPHLPHELPAVLAREAADVPDVQDSCDSAQAAGAGPGAAAGAATGRRPAGGRGCRREPTAPAGSGRAPRARGAPASTAPAAAGRHPQRVCEESTRALALWRLPKCNHNSRSRSTRLPGLPALRRLALEWERVPARSESSKAVLPPREASFHPVPRGLGLGWEDLPRRCGTRIPTVLESCLLCQLLSLLRSSSPHRNSTRWQWPRRKRFEDAAEMTSSSGNLLR